MAESVCKNCIYFMIDPQSRVQTGWCRRYPPRVLWIDSPNMPGPNMNPDVHSFMPAVHEDLWCGEYKFKGSGKAKTKARGKGK